GRLAYAVVLLALAAGGELAHVLQPHGARLFQLLQCCDESVLLRPPVLGAEPGPGAQMMPGGPVAVGGEAFKASAQRGALLRGHQTRIANLACETAETGHLIPPR